MSFSVTIIMAFLNTCNAMMRTDAFADPNRAAQWMGRQSLGIGLVPSIQDLLWAVEVREAIRDMVAGNSGGVPSVTSLEVLNRAARMVSLGVQFEAGAATAAAPPFVGLQEVVTRTLAAVHDAMADGSWSRLKVCRNPECGWAFYDRSKNHSGVWCAMAECGNKMKARRFRRRRQQETAGGQASSHQ